MSPHAEPHVLNGLIRAAIAAAESAGAPRAESLAVAGVSEVALSERDARSPVRGLLDLLEQLPPDGALSALSRLSPADLGALGYGLSHSRSLGGALEIFLRYQALVTDAVTWRLEGDLLRVEPAPEGPDDPRGLIALGLGLWVALARGLIGRRWRPVEVLSRGRADHPAARAFFEAPITCGAPIDAIRLGPGAARLPIVGARPALRPSSIHLIEAHLALLQDEAMSTRVRGVIRQRLSVGGLDKRDVARQLGVSERTLGRRLREEGASFRDLLDETRRDLAQQWLRDPSLMIYRIAFLLGYDEPTSFHRAFRRWTGTSPDAWRRAQLEPPLPAALS